MKKYMMLFAIVIIAVLGLGACGSGSGEESTGTGSGDENKIRIVTTIFPAYDWVMNVLGDRAGQAEVTMLLDDGVDLHSFQPAADDILKISTCDLFIYVGGESDGWVDDALAEAVNKDMVVINLLDVLGDHAREEEVVEGMQAEEGGEEEAEYDEHVWLSLKNAAVLVKSISEALQTIDEAGAQTYEKNTASYAEKLDALDHQYQEMIATAPVKTLLFGDRFPFRYLTEDYGLSYYAAFAGCSAETEASFETITFLADKVDELSLKAVMTCEGNDHKIAETIIENTRTKDQKILTLNSMQAVTSEDVANGTSYLSVMENNLSVLKDALK